jgi:hypothetical protein
MSPKVFIFVIASFGDPVYKELILLRKLQLSKYKIPHYFLFDELSDYTMDQNDIYIKKENIESKAIVNPNMNPFMIQRFLKGIKLIDEYSYDYIIRVNISTFINIPVLLKELEPRNKFVLGHIMYQNLSEWDEYCHNKLVLFAGTCIVMSNDVITYLKSIDINNLVLHKHNDDTVLSHLINQYIEKYSKLNIHYLENNICCDESLLNNYSLFRIKNTFDRNYDILHWKYLLEKIDNIKV